jgi:hypothetical protein
MSSAFDWDVSVSVESEAAGPNQGTSALPPEDRRAGAPCGSLPAVFSAVITAIAVSAHSHGSIMAGMTSTASRTIFTSHRAKKIASVFQIQFPRRHHGTALLSRTVRQRHPLKVLALCNEANRGVPWGCFSVAHHLFCSDFLNTFTFI